MAGRKAIARRSETGPHASRRPASRTDTQPRLPRRWSSCRPWPSLPWQRSTHQVMKVCWAGITPFGFDKGWNEAQDEGFPVLFWFANHKMGPFLCSGLGPTSMKLKQGPLAWACHAAGTNMPAECVKVQPVGWHEARHGTGAIRPPPDGSGSGGVWISSRNKLPGPRACRPCSPSWPPRPCRSTHRPW